MKIIPLLDTPAQTLQATLGGQACTITLRQKTSGALYCDLYVNDGLIIGGVVCQNVNPIVRDAYLGFVGDLAFLDNQGSDDPASPGLGTRFSLVYLEASDLA